MPALTASTPAASTVPGSVTHLRSLAMTWAAAGLLPLPLLGAGDPDGSAGIACLYLALASGWLATEFVRTGGPPASLRAWRAKILAIALAVAANVAAFVAVGLAAGVRTNIPFPLLAALSAIPAVGLVPWLTPRVREPYAAIILAALIALAAKLTGCVVAAVVYGPGFLEQGYVAADWNTAKLMIATFWGMTTALSLSALADSWRRWAPGREPIQLPRVSALPLDAALAPVPPSSAGGAADHRR